jgi:hypothetical protein
MLEFVDELPSEARVNASRPSQDALSALFGELASRPNTWAILEKDTTINRVATWRARADRLTSGGFVFAAHGDTDKKTIYGRYVGNTEI